MKKLLYLVLVSAALMVRPVSGSDDPAHTTPANVSIYGSSDATELIPEKVREILDKLRAAPREPHKHPAVHAVRDDSGQHHIQLAAITSDYYGALRPNPQQPPARSETTSDSGNWPLFAAALLLIGFIIRRRTAVR